MRELQVVWWRGRDRVINSLKYGNIVICRRQLLRKVGVDIMKIALSYPLKLIAKNASVNGSVVSEKVLSSDMG
ncbi:hypothetical protein RJT34_02391 [Clitoria ternatea]|uniref:Uncharacterized protein n=1 Tax=Clitoria ternatea TaxID=43366 RepID=A0AAN9Q0B9_CLITE